MRLIKRVMRRKRRLMLLIWLVLAIHRQVNAQETLIPAPTPTATPIPIDAGGLYEALGDANDDLAGLGSDLSAPNGMELLPGTDGSEVFRYAKWLLMPSSADELAGPFAPIITHTGIFVSLVIALSVVYGIVYIAVYLIKFVIWIFKLILFIIQVVVSVIGSIFKFFF